MLSVLLILIPAKACWPHWFWLFPLMESCYNVFTPQTLVNSPAQISWRREVTDFHDMWQEPLLIESLSQMNFQSPVFNGKVSIKVRTLLKCGNLSASRIFLPVFLNSQKLLSCDIFMVTYSHSFSVKELLYRFLSPLPSSPGFIILVQVSEDEMQEILTIYWAFRKNIRWQCLNYLYMIYVLISLF